MFPEREPELAHASQERRTFRGESIAFRDPREQLGLECLLQTSQALAERGLTKAESFRGSPKMSVLGDYREVFDIPQLHADNLVSWPNECRMIEPLMGVCKRADADGAEHIS